MNRLHGRMLATIAAAAAIVPATATAASYQPGGFDVFGNRDLVVCAADRAGTDGADRNQIDAGPGDDKISSANGIAEVVRCGSGRDEVWADRSDKLIGCERVHRIASLYPVATPGKGSPQSVFRASIRAPFTTET